MYGLALLDGNLIGRLSCLFSMRRHLAQILPVCYMNIQFWSEYSGIN